MLSLRRLATAVLTLAVIGAPSLAFTGSNGASVVPTGAAAPLGAPGAPTIDDVYENNRFVYVLFSPPTDTGSSAITSYVATASPGGATATVPATATYAIVEGLTNGAEYTFTVVAMNAAGSSAPSVPSEVSSPWTFPDPPTNVVATPLDGGVEITWTPPTDTGGRAISNYFVYGQPGNWSVPSRRGEASAGIYLLENGTAYTFTVRTVTTVGGEESAPSAPVTPHPAPAPPTAIAAVAGVGSAVVSWSVPEDDGGSPVTGYLVTTYPTAKRTWIEGDATTTVIDGLTSGNSYEFTVNAYSEVGSGPPSIRSTPIIVEDSLHRVAGADRFATAATIAARFPAGVDTVYVASGLNFPDALAGAALAASQDAPVLLARPDGVPQPTLDALRRLKPERIVILGGEPTLNDVVRQQLAPYGTVSRIAGADRFATAAAISERFAPGVDTVYVASGMNFPDALAGASLAGATGAPVLLTAPGDLRPSVQQALERLDPGHIVLLGGAPSVSTGVEQALAEYGEIRRIAGADRFETAALIAAEFPAADRVYVANGANFPDALAGAALAGSQGAPVLLALRDGVLPSTVYAVQRLAPEQIIVLGDTNAISASVGARLKQLI